MGAGNKVDDSEALVIRANKGERASMWCFTCDVGSGSSSHDFVEDASAIFSHPRVTQVQTHRTHNSWHVIDWQRRSIMAQRLYLFFETSLEADSECRV